MAWGLCWAAWLRGAPGLILPEVPGIGNPARFPGSLWSLLVLFFCLSGFSSLFQPGDLPSLPQAQLNVTSSSRKHALTSPTPAVHWEPSRLLCVAVVLLCIAQWPGSLLRAGRCLHH